MTTRNRRRSLAALGVAAIAAVVLTGCQGEWNIVLHEDDTVDGSLRVLLTSREEQGLNAMGMTIDGFWDLIKYEMSDMADSGELRDLREDGLAGKEMVFARTSLSDPGLLLEGDELSIVRDGEDFVVSGALAVEDLGKLLDLMDSDGDMTLSVTFPGEVKVSDGTVSGSTVTWAVNPKGTTAISARGSAVAGEQGGELAEPDAAGDMGPNLGLTLPVAGGLLAVAIAGLVLALRAARTRETSSAPDAAGQQQPEVPPQAPPVP